MHSKVQIMGYLAMYKSQNWYFWRKLLFFDPGGALKKNLFKDIYNYQKTVFWTRKSDLQLLPRWFGALCQTYIWSAAVCKFPITMKADGKDDLDTITYSCPFCRFWDWYCNSISLKYLYSVSNKVLGRLLQGKHESTTSMVSQGKSSLTDS